MGIIAIGLNHSSAPIHIRERLSFTDANIDSSYELLGTYSHISESFILSTCNRVEIYAVGYDRQRIADDLLDFLFRTHEVTCGSLKPCLYKKTDEEALHHLFRVACGLDSMIIGENQILGQIKRAYEKAILSDAVGVYLHGLLQDALNIGRRVRRLTNISKGVTSFSGAALELIKRHENNCYKKILVIGAGKVGSMTVGKLAGFSLRELVVINRDQTKAESLKGSQNIKIASLSALKKELFNADIVIAATSSVSYLITKEMVRQALGKRGQRLLLIDLGLPRNIEESVKDIQGVKLYNVDDLRPIIEETMNNRTAEAKKAEEIIRKQLCARLSLV
jgi:glutamyl-tRNA reductase